MYFEEESDDELPEMSFTDSQSSQTSVMVERDELDEPMPQSQCVISLDDIVNERNVQVVAQIRRENLRFLSDEINGNGDMNVDDPVDSYTEGDLPPEIAGIAETYDKVATEERVPITHPGPKIFGSCDLCLFNESITADECGVSVTEEFLQYTAQPVTYPMIQLCVRSSLLLPTHSRWLLFVLSVHEDQRVVDICVTQLARMILCHNDPTSHGIPLKDFLIVFTNWGLKIHTFLAPPPDNEQIRCTLETVANMPRISKTPATTTERHLDVYNVNKVLKLVTMAVQKSQFTCLEEREFLMRLLCNIAIDPLFDNSTLNSACHLCMSAIMDTFTEEEYDSKAAELCHMITNLANHHHTMHHLTDTLPPSTHLQRWVAYHFLCAILPCMKLHPLSSQSVKMEWLLPVLTPIIYKSTSDPYFYLSVVHLLRMAVGTGHLDSLDTECLQMLSEGLYTLTTNQKDSIRRHHMSELVLACELLACTWSDRLHTTTFIKRDILSTPSTPVKVTTIESNTPCVDQESVIDLTDLPDLQPGIGSGIDSGIHSDIHTNTSGIQSDIHPGINSGIQSGTEPGIHSGIHSDIHKGIEPGIHPGIHTNTSGITPDLSSMKIKQENIDTLTNESKNVKLEPGCDSKTEATDICVTNEHADEVNKCKRDLLVKYSLFDEESKIWC